MYVYTCMTFIHYSTFAIIIEYNKLKKNSFPLLSTEQLKSLCKQYHDRICKLEDQKYDLEYVVKRKDVEVYTKYQNSNKKRKSISTKFLLLSYYFTLYHVLRFTFHLHDN